MDLSLRSVDLLGSKWTVYVSAKNEAYFQARDVLDLGGNAIHRGNTKRSPGEFIRPACQAAGLPYNPVQISSQLWVVPSSAAFCYIAKQIGPGKAAELSSELLQGMLHSENSTIKSVMGNSSRGSKFQRVISAVAASDEHKQYALATLAPTADARGPTKQFTDKGAKQQRTDYLNVWDNAFAVFSPIIPASDSRDPDAVLPVQPTAFSPPPPAAGDIKDSSRQPQQFTPLLSDAEPPINRNVIAGYAQLFLHKPHYFFKILLALSLLWPGKQGPSDFARLVLNVLFPTLGANLTDKAAAVFYGLSASRQRWTNLVRTLYAPLSKLLGLNFFPPVSQLKEYFARKIDGCLWFTTRPLPESVKLPKFVSNCPGDVQPDDVHASTRKLSSLIPVVSHSKYTILFAWQLLRV